MTFNPLAAVMTFKCKNILTNEPNPVALDLGSQTSRIDKNFLKKFLEINNGISIEIKSNIEQLIKKGKFSTKEYFNAINFHDYSSIDINGAYESYNFDLNLNIKEDYNFNKKFDLVINNGTSEHIFNQSNFFLNFHNLTQVNGLMLNIVPFIDWINHGFYNYNPIFFADLAAANGYEILKICLGNRNAAILNIDKKFQKTFFDQIKPNNDNSEFKNIISLARSKLGENIILVVILKKINEEIFKSPLQGKYLDDIKRNKSNYSDQSTGSESAKGQIPDNYKRK